MNPYPNPDTNPRAGKIFAGLIILTIGVIMLLQVAGFHFPGWLISWEMLAIALGLFIGFRSSFRNPAWFILVTLGAIFLTEDFFPYFHARRFLWPVLIILLGLWMIFGRSRARRHQPFPTNTFTPPPGPQPGAFRPEPAEMSAPGADLNPAPDTGRISGLDTLNVTAILGGSKKIVVSKNFQGGEIFTFMGGAEINLSQADIQGKAVLDITQVMGGVKLLVPSNWMVIPELTVILGGIDDKRLVLNQAPDKVLIIKGTAILGGLEING